jgi:hypothetical protein
MKKILAILGITIFLISCGAKEQKKEIVPEKKVEETKTPIIVKKGESKPVLIFTVQIGAFKKNNTTFSALENVQVSLEKSMYKYRLGSFKTYIEAKAYRRTILHKFQGAFVQAVKNNQPIYIEEALK